MSSLAFSWKGILVVVVVLIVVVGEAEAVLRGHNPNPNPNDILNDNDNDSGSGSGNGNGNGNGTLTRTRAKRFPAHLDPNFNPFSWIRIGECPTSVDGTRQNFCPKPDKDGRWVCVDDFQLCNGIKNCPNAEDENNYYCFFYRVLKAQVELLTRSIAKLTQLTSSEDIELDSFESLLPSQFYSGS